jgi:hypothetical protein
MSREILTLVHDHLKRYTEARIIVEGSVDSMQITLPGMTADGHLVTVYAERLMGGLWKVHDAASAISELWVEGLNIKTVQRALVQKIAERMGVEVDEQDAFAMHCKLEDLPRAAWRVRDAAALLSSALLRHRAAITRRVVLAKSLERLRSQPGRFEVEERPKLRGKRAEHRFDMAVRPRRKDFPITVKILSAGAGPWLSAEAYAFTVSDVGENYGHVAVLHDPEQWSRKSVELIRGMGAAVVLEESPDQAAERLKSVVEEKVAALDAA